MQSSTLVERRSKLLLRLLLALLTLLLPGLLLGLLALALLLPGLLLLLALLHLLPFGLALFVAQLQGLAFLADLASKQHGATADFCGRAGDFDLVATLNLDVLTPFELAMELLRPGVNGDRAVVFRAEPIADAWCGTGLRTERADGFDGALEAFFLLSVVLLVKLLPALKLLWIELTGTAWHAEDLPVRLRLVLLVNLLRLLRIGKLFHVLERRLLQLLLGCLNGQDFALTVDVDGGPWQNGLLFADAERAAVGHHAVGRHAAIHVDHDVFDLAEAFALLVFDPGADEVAESA